MSDLPWEHWKLQGMEASRNQDYCTACNFYTHALNSGPIPPIELSKILSNRSQAFFRLGMITDALNDAKYCINCNPTWCKGYWRAGQACMELNDMHTALKNYFIPGIKYLSNNTHDQDTKVDFIVEIVTLCYNLTEWQYVTEEVRASDHVWSSVVQRLATQKRWEMMSRLFLNKQKGFKTKAFNLKNEPARIKAQHIDFRHMLQEAAASLYHRFRQQLTVKLLEYNGQLKYITVKVGDTPLHASLQIMIHDILKSRNHTFEDCLYQHLMQHNYRTAILRSIRDSGGNTILHLIVQHMNQVGENMVHGGVMKIFNDLLHQGIDSFAENNASHLAIDYLFPRGNIHKALDCAMEKRKHALFGKPTAIPTLPEENQLTADKEFNNAKGFLKIKLYLPSLKSYGRFLNASEQQSYKDIAVKDILFTILPQIKEFEEHVSLELPPAMWNSMMEKLAVNEKWDTMYLLLLGGGAGYKYGVSGLARTCNLSNVNITEFVEKYDGSSVRLDKYKFVQTLIEHGADPNGICDSTKNPIGVSMKKKDYKMVMTCLKFGADPTYMSDEDNTPLHVALNVCLGIKDFELLAFLLDLYKVDMEKYHELNPHSQDIDGNTLYHLAADGKYTPQSLEACKLLLKYKCNPLIHNAENKSALSLFRKAKKKKVPTATLR